MARQNALVCLPPSGVPHGALRRRLAMRGLALALATAVIVRARRSRPGEPAGGDATDPRAIARDPGLPGRLLGEFDRVVARLRPALTARYGAATAALVAEARAEYAALLPALPYIGGRHNPLTRNLEGSALWLALWRVLRRRGTLPEEAGRLFCALAEEWLRTYPRPVLRLLGRLQFTRWSRARLRRQAAASQRRSYPGDWVFQVVEGSGVGGGFGVDYTECGIVKFYRAQGGVDILPYICPLDAPMSRALGQGLVRTTTLAEGGGRCDFRYTRGGPTCVATPWDRGAGESACPGCIAGKAEYLGCAS